MSARRSQISLAAAGVVLVSILIAVFAGRGEGGLGAGGDGPQGAAGGARPAEGAEGPSGDGDREPGPGPQAAPRDGDRETMAQRPHAPRAGTVDLIVVDETGAGLLNPARSPLAPDVIFWLEPVLIEGRNVPATVPPGATRLRRTGSQVRSISGWYTAFERPPGEAHAALLYGDRILCSEPIMPGQNEVVLVATEADIAALQCTVRGRIAGLDQAGRHVRVQPVGRAGQVLAPILGQGEDEGFEVVKIPPGRCQLLVRFDPGVLVQKLIQSAPPGQPISLGSRVTDAEQWRFRVETLSKIQQPWLLMELELVPGEDRDVGQLVGGQGGAALLALVDERGEPVPAHKVDVRILTPPGASIPAPQSWAFENLAMLHPLPVSLLQMTVVQGSRGALLNVRPAALGGGLGGGGGGPGGFPQTQVVLSPLSVIALPLDGESRLLTEVGAELASDPRWTGGRYMGHPIHATTMLVPGGRYRFERRGGQGSATSVEVAPGMYVDLRESAPVVSPLRPADRKMREANR